MVMGGTPCIEGHGFESQHRILDGHFSQIHYIKSENVEKNLAVEKMPVIREELGSSFKESDRQQGQQLFPEFECQS